MQAANEAFKQPLKSFKSAENHKKEEKSKILTEDEGVPGPLHAADGWREHWGVVRVVPAKPVVVHLRLGFGQDVDGEAELAHRQTLVVLA